MLETPDADRPITVRWTMEADDILGGSRLYQRRVWLFLRVGVVIAGALGVVFFAIGADASLWLPPVAVAVLFGFYVLLGIRRSVTRQGRSVIGEEVVFLVDAEGAHQDLAGGHSWIEWRVLTAVIENETTIILKRDRMPSYFIPKRAFASGAEAAALVAYMRAHLGTTPVAG